MLAIEEISRMSSRERIDAMELLWKSFSSDGIAYPSPDWHQPVLEQRNEILESDKATWLTMEELESRLKGH